MQGKLTTIMQMFEWVIFYMNLENTNYMACIPGFIWGQLDKDAYKRRTTSESATFGEQKRTKVSCDECGGTVEVFSLRNHM